MLERVTLSTAARLYTRRIGNNHRTAFALRNSPSDVMGSSTKAEPQRPVDLDGRVGEGGGQLVRIATAISAITGTPIRIHHVRANRARGGRGGGLKAQHVACMRYLADATAAKLIDCDVGSSSVEFWPTLSPPHLLKRDVKIVSDSVGSILLVFQALLPFLVMASSTDNTPITLTIEGGTNVSFSPSFEYVDQVLLPALERFGISVERKLDCRGWSQGSRQIGSIRFTINPLPFGQTLESPDWPSERGEIAQIDVSMVVPAAMHDDMKKAFLVELNTVFPEVNVEVLLVEDSGHKARMYALLVAHTSTGLRFGRDWLYDKTSKNKSPEALSIEMARGIVAGLERTVCRGGLVDEHLQDQLIIFQTLAAGMSVIPGSLETLNSSRERVEKTDEPFGDGTKHTTTARWVTSQVLPTEVKWIDRGRVCHGVGWKNEPSESGIVEKSTGRIVT